MNTMAWAIALAQILMVIAPAVLAVWVLKRWRVQRSGRLLGAAVGLALGSLWMARTFFEGATSRPPELTFEVPGDFAHETVILITDPSSPREVAWSGDGRFAAKRGRLAVPKSGIVRVRSLGLIDGHTVNAMLSDGRREWGFGVFAPNGVRTAYFTFADVNQAKEQEIDRMEPEQLARYLREREAEH